MIEVRLKDFGSVEEWNPSLKNIIRRLDIEALFNFRIWRAEKMYQNRYR